MLSATYIFWVFLDNILIWTVQAYQDEIGKYEKKICIISLGQTLAFFVLYLENFLFEFIWYTLFPCVVLYRSKSWYYQIWSRSRSRSVKMYFLQNKIKMTICA